MLTCTCCGSAQFRGYDVLWDALIEEWGLSADEIEYINRQQGLICIKCGANLRSMALAQAVMMSYGYRGVFKRFVQEEGGRLSVLEVNEAGTLNRFLREVSGHRLVRYPDVDMSDLPFDSGSFDLVLHSDTLEHVPDPVRGLAECRRVLVPGGICAFTVPMVVGRLSEPREGKPPSYHGSPTNPADCLVHTEYGADVWKHVVLSGFNECRIMTLEHPAAHAFVGVNAG